MEHVHSEYHSGRLFSCGETSSYMAIFWINPYSRMAALKSNCRKSNTIFEPGTAFTRPYLNRWRWKRHTKRRSCGSPWWMSQNIPAWNRRSARPHPPLRRRIRLGMKEACLARRPSALGEHLSSVTFHASFWSWTINRWTEYDKRTSVCRPSGEVDHGNRAKFVCRLLIFIVRNRFVG